MTGENMTDAEKDMDRRISDLIEGLRHSTKEGERDADALEAIMSDRTTLRAEVERLTEERKARHPRQFKYAPTPWSYEGNSDDGYYLLDANGQKIVMLLWPIHPVEETEAVEAEAPLLADFLAFQSAWLTATTLDFFDMERRADKAEAERDAAIARAEKAEAALNTPEILDFTKAVVSEAAHQRARWPSEHDAGKSDADWYWLIGYLAGKALHNPTNEMPSDEARLHRIVTVAAAAANWHLSALGKTNMRPGTDQSALASLTEGE